VGGRWTRHAAYERERRNEYRVLVGKQEGSFFEDRGTDGRITLQWILNK
jgi:hypothetical protein